MANPLMQESIWFDRPRVEEAETKYQQHVASQRSGLVVQSSSSNLVSEIARARQNIQSSLSSSAGVGLNVGVSVENTEVLARLSAVEKENAQLKKVTADLEAAVAKLTERLSALTTTSASTPAPQAAQAPVQNGKPAVDDDDDDDDDSDFDCFASEDEEEKKAKEAARDEALQKYQAKKSKKPALIAKSNIILDVKPWDDETDMDELEKAVRTVQCDGLLWGASKFVPLAYGIRKLQITCVVEDEKVGTDFLEEEITKFEDLIQSVDVAAFNKV